MSWLCSQALEAAARAGYEGQELLERRPRAVPTPVPTPVAPDVPVPYDFSERLGPKPRRDETLLAFDRLHPGCPPTSEWPMDATNYYIAPSGRWYDGSYPVCRLPELAPNCHITRAERDRLDVLKAATGDNVGKTQVMVAWYCARVHGEDSDDQVSERELYAAREHALRRLRREDHPLKMFYNDHGWSVCFTLDTPEARKAMADAGWRECCVVGRDDVFQNVCDSDRFVEWDNSNDPDYFNPVPDLREYEADDSFTLYARTPADVLAVDWGKIFEGK